jgi:hypothetical protein
MCIWPNPADGTDGIWKNFRNLHLNPTKTTEFKAIAGDDDDDDDEEDK